jgi:hypothetical protein
MELDMRVVFGASAGRFQRKNCFSCGRPTPAGRFCDDDCRDWYDRGGPAFDPEPDLSWSFSLPLSGDGFEIVCSKCGGAFSSRGQRFCEECYRQQQESGEVLA